jgi:hypothetical protein
LKKKTTILNINLKPIKIMRKIIFGLIITIAISNSSFGQAILEQSYLTKGWDYDRFNSFITQSGVNYFTLDKSTATLKLFNSSHTLFKTVIIPLAPGYELTNISTVNDILFNSDTFIEFIAFSQSGTTRRATLVNENSIVLQEFGNKREANIIKVGASYKMITMIEPFEIPGATDFQFDVYSLPGTTLNVTSNTIDENLFFGYPNPTQNFISITNNLQIGQNGILEIFDMNGKKLLEKNVRGENSEINIDVTEFTTGVYIYKLNGKTNRFVKK